jgi:hypothetical protein
MQRIYTPLLDLCIISPAVTGEGVEKPDDFNPNKHIKKVGVRIRPKNILKESIQNTGLEKE